MEPHILHTRDVLRTLEVFARPVLAALPSVIHKILGHFAKGSAFLAEVDDDATTTFLGLFDSLLHAEDEVGSACANIGTEDITTIALVVDAESKSDVRIRHFRRVTEDVYREATDGGKEELDVGACDEFGIGATGLFEQSPPKCAFIYLGVSGRAMSQKPCRH